MGAILQDLKFACRMLIKNPAFTIVAVLTLALGIGANSAIFSVVSAVLLKPLPFRNPNQLLFLSGQDLRTKAPGILVSYTKFTEIREQNHTLQDIGGYYGSTLSLLTTREPEAIYAARTSRNLFSILGISPSRGREFLPEEEAIGAADVAIITDGFWHSHFAADPKVPART